MVIHTAVALELARVNDVSHDEVLVSISAIS